MATNTKKKKKIVRGTEVGRAFVKQTASGPELVVSLNEKGIRVMAELQKDGYTPEFRFGFEEIR